MSENATPRTAKQQFDDALEDDKIPPLERLRFFCSLAFKEPQDWLDVEPFFDDIERELSAANARIAELEKSGQSVAEDSSECIIALDRAHKRIAELEKDAARYRWLRVNGDHASVFGPPKYPCPDDLLQSLDLDTAIDAAMSAKEKP